MMHKFKAHPTLNAPCAVKCLTHGRGLGVWRHLVQYYAVAKVCVLILVTRNTPDYRLLCVDSLHALRVYCGQPGGHM